MQFSYWDGFVSVLISVLESFVPNVESQLLMATFLTRDKTSTKRSILLQFCSSPGLVIKYFKLLVHDLWKLSGIFTRHQVYREHLR